MEGIEYNSYSYYRLYEKIALVSLLKREMRKHSGNITCGNNDIQSKKKQHNINNNNNSISLEKSIEENHLLHFYIFDVSRERNLHLSTNSYDKRLLIFYNISNGLYKSGLRNGDILIYLNETNVLKPPIALTIDRVKSEFTALRRQNKSIRIGICRTIDRSLLNNTTIKHLSSLTSDEFKNLSENISSSENSPTLSNVNRDSKKLLNLFSNKKKSPITQQQQQQQQNSMRDSGFSETDVEHSQISNSNKDEIPKLCEIKKVPSNETSSCHLPTQVLTDACFIYRRQVIKPPPPRSSNAMIARGREIAYEAANAPTIPTSMQNYTHDQIRELYGESDKKSLRIQDNGYIIHTPLIDLLKEKPLSIDPCPLPKFRIDKTDQTIVMTAYLSTGLSNKPPAIINSNEPHKDIIRGSFRTSIDDRTEINPSPVLFNIHLDFDKILSTSTLTNTSQQTELNCLTNQDQDTYKDVNDNSESDVLTSPFQITQEKTSIVNEEESVKSEQNVEITETDLLFTEENTYQYITNGIEEDFQELYQRYMTDINQYEKILEQIENHNEKKPQVDYSTLTVQRQLNHIGHYGFEIEQTFDGKIKISSIINSSFCPNLQVGDELIYINNHFKIISIEQCYLLLHSLWYKQYDYIHITVRKSSYEPVSLQSSTLSWPLSIVESGRRINAVSLFLRDY